MGMGISRTRRLVWTDRSRPLFLVCDYVDTKCLFLVCTGLSLNQIRKFFDLIFSQYLFIV